MGWKHWDEGKFTALLLKTGQTISYHAGDDGDLQLGVAPDFTILTTGRYAGSVNLIINSKTHVTSNACVKDKNTGLLIHREAIQADLGPAADGKLFWDQYTLGPKIDITFTAATKIIHSVAGDFDTGACCVGRKITVSGAAQAGNNQDVTVTGITANNMTVNEAIVNEGAGASVSFASVDDLIWNLVAQANIPPGLAGYTDWRIPNFIELMSIVDFGAKNPCVDTTFFPSTPNSFFWTSTQAYGLADHFRAIDFGSMIAGYSLKATTKYHVRLVRN